MRYTITFLVFIMFLLLSNIIAYFVSEDYRFFLKKIKYREEIVYDTEIIIDDTDNYIEIATNSGSNKTSEKEYILKDKVTFLDTLSGKGKISDKDEQLQELIGSEKQFLRLFESFLLEESKQKTNLFDITTEYPDDYYDYYSKNLSIYVFPSKSYEEVFNIFDVLAFELPYTLKKLDNFGNKSFYINIAKQYNDNTVRIVLEYKKRVFGLKIKKDIYNEVKEILNGLITQ